MLRDEPDMPEQFDSRPWNHLKTTFDVEAWIDHYNRHLQRSLDNKIEAGYGICFTMVAGGEIYMHTTSEGEVLLDVMPDAQWVTPAITAATGIADPQSQIWILPAEALTQFVLGLSSLIDSSSTVHTHDFKLKKY
ncbi:MAG: hypothetical protein V4805_19290 [Pseudomonadota bacterium]